ncbi:MAG: hypothetical protein KIH01_06295 [Candidatus Freyarchaeota archaeon]|nr:hypothetical protein [Candidatus Jordarchaeia archaeon]
MLRVVWSALGGGALKVSVEPHKRYLEVDLNKYPWIPKDFDGVGGAIITENKLIKRKKLS